MNDPKAKASWSSWLQGLIGTVLILLLPIGGLALHGYVKWGYGPTDTLIWLICQRSDTTVWAPGYSRAAFNRVRPGMTEIEVRALLGEPIVIHGSSWARSLEYADSSSDGDHHRRGVLFEGGVVNQIYSGYYSD